VGLVQRLGWILIVAVMLLVIYLPGLHNAPVFDDDLLTSGTLFEQYRSLTSLRPRLLSYATFVWLQDLFGQGWWKQRLINFGLHLCVVVAIWGFYREIIRCIDATDGSLVPGAAATQHKSYLQPSALAFAVGFFALNPMAVYAVAYLIQRSILMATLFVLLGFWSFARALRVRRWRLLVLSATCYVLAVMSKEHAIMMPFAALPIYIIIARPNRRHLIRMALLGTILTAVAGVVLAMKYGAIIGKPFDQFSKVYLAQLAALGPDVESSAYPLSIINQTFLFFRYGILWFLPYSNWMSIDMRTVFPVSLWTFPHVLGAAGFVSVIIGGLFLVIRFKDWRALIGLSVLIPALLFFSEFATVWIQDPFVLYRSYLWAIGVPGLVYGLVHGLPGRALLLVGLLLGAGLCWQAMDRVQSMVTPKAVWSDAIAKLPNDPRAVGRWFPYLNRGNIYLDDDRYREAYEDFRASAALGDKGMGLFNLAAMHYIAGRYEAALGAINGAEKQGYDFPGLAYQRGVILYALGRMEEAYRQLTAAVAESTTSPQREEALAYQGRTALEMGDVDAAISALDAALKIDPAHKKARLSMGMARGRKGDHQQALAIFDRLLAEGDFGRARYGRALAYLGLKRRTDAIADLEAAVRQDPENQQFKTVLARVRAQP
jgi:protein O-mannosyl-transferase